MAPDAGVRTIVLPALRPGFIGGPFFYVVGPILALAVSGLRRDVAVVCQSPFEGFGVTLLGRLLRSGAALGSRSSSTVTGGRVLDSTVAGLAACSPPSRIERAPGRCGGPIAFGWSANRSSSSPDARYRREIDRFITFSDYRMFLDRPPVPLPDTPTAAFIGVLERYKAVDVLLDAWPLVLREVPDARLWLVGAGSMQTSCTVWSRPRRT